VQQVGELRQQVLFVLVEAAVGRRDLRDHLDHGAPLRRRQRIVQHPRKLVERHGLLQARLGARQQRLGGRALE